MGVVDDIIDRIGEILDETTDTILSKGLEMIAKVLISGGTIVGSSIPIALASWFNSQVGYIDPLTLSPVATYEAAILISPPGFTLECFETRIPPLSQGGLETTLFDTSRRNMIEFGDRGLKTAVKENFTI